MHDGHGLLSGYQELVEHLDEVSLIGLELNTEDMESVYTTQDVGRVYVDRLVDMLEPGDELVVVGHSFGGEVVVTVGERRCRCEINALD